MTALRYGLGVLAGLAVAASASADEARGRILQIDPDKKILRLQAGGPLRGGGVLEVKIDAKTEIVIGGQPATLNDLAPGRRVRVLFEPRDGGRPVAQVIRSLGLLGGPPRSPAAPSAPLKEGEGVAGTLQRVSLADREVVVIGPGTKGERTETTVAVPEETAIRRDGQKIKLDDLKEGEAVTVRTESRKGQLTAVSIDAGRAAAAPAMPPRRDIIPRLRQALKLADELLREMEEQKQGGPDRP